MWVDRNEQGRQEPTWVSLAAHSGPCQGAFRNESSMDRREGALSQQVNTVLPTDSALLQLSSTTLMSHPYV